MATWTELVDERNTVINRLQAIGDGAAEEFRTSKREANVLSPEEQENTDRLTKDLDGIEAELGAMQKQRELSQRLEQAKLKTDELKTWGDRPERQPVDKMFSRGRSNKPNSGSAYYGEFKEWLRTGQYGPEMRALQKDVDTAGGYTVSPEEFLSDLIRNVDDLVQIRQMARKFTTTAHSIGVPVLTNKLAAATWGTELQVATADTTMTFGKRRLTPHPETAQILVSKLLPLQSGVGIDELVRTEFARVIGELQETAFMEGDGNAKPLGCFIGSVDGISTARDVTTSSSSANITADNLIATTYALKPQYRARAEWLFNRTRLRAIRTLKDNNNQYLWTAGLGYTQSMVVGQGATLLDRPYRESEFAPGVTASPGSSGVGVNSSGYTAILGDFGVGYWIADGASLGVNRYDQINAATGQDTYIGLFQVDGAPVLEEAFARARLST